MLQVAQVAGVSYQTVSRVINDSPNVSAATRRRVQEVIGRLGYRPSNSARTLAGHHSRTIGFVAGGTNYYGPISTMAAVESVARKHGLYLSVAILEEAEYRRGALEDVCQNMLGQGVDAIILLTPTEEMYTAAASLRLPVPSVILTSTLFGGDPEADAVSHRASNARIARTRDARVRTLSARTAHANDDPASGEPATRAPRQFLGIDQAGACMSMLNYLSRLGHRSFLFFTGPQQWGDARVRLSAWRDAVLHGLRGRFVPVGSWDADAAYNTAISTLAGLRGGDLPTAIVASNDLQAFAILKALHDLSIRVPEDVSVVGFDDMTGSNVTIPALTTVHQDFAQLGAEAMRVILHQLGEEVNVPMASDPPLDSSEPMMDAERGSEVEGSTRAFEKEEMEGGGDSTLRLYPARLVVRDSTAPPAQAPAASAAPTRKTGYR